MLAEMCLIPRNQVGSTGTSCFITQTVMGSLWLSYIFDRTKERLTKPCSLYSVCANGRDS